MVAVAAVIEYVSGEAAAYVALIVISFDKVSKPLITGVFVASPKSQSC